MERGASPTIWTKLTAQANEADGVRPAAPLDIGCGFLKPLRWSKNCVLYSYDHADTGASDVVEDKPFEMHVIVQTTRGRWDFHGKRGVEDVDSSLLVAGVHRDRYGCRHDRRFGDGNIVASLNTCALDEDDPPIFGLQTLPIDTRLSLARSVAAPSLEEFDSRIFEIFDYVSMHSLRETRERRASRLRMQRVKRFIEDHACEPLTLSDIAACVGLSPFVCLRQFKSHTGMTPHVYLTRLKLHQAQHLLKKTRLSIADVALAVGIRDQCYFSRWFAKESGITPSAFRLG